MGYNVYRKLFKFFQLPHFTLVLKVWKKLCTYQKVQLLKFEKDLYYFSHIITYYLEVCAHVSLKLDTKASYGGKKLFFF